MIALLNLPVPWSLAQFTCSWPSLHVRSEGCLRDVISRSCGSFGARGLLDYRVCRDEVGVTGTLVSSSGRARSFPTVSSRRTYVFFLRYEYADKTCDIVVMDAFLFLFIAQATLKCGRNKNLRVNMVSAGLFEMQAKKQ